MEFMREFPDDEACLEHLWRSRYAADGEHAYCERCAKVRSFKRYKGTTRTRQVWTCTSCSKQLAPTAGTIFHKSSTSLHLWYFAIFLITSTRCGISAKQLERELGVTYKTAWRMFNKIRNQLMEQDYQGPLGGEVEADESWVGGKPRMSHRRQMREAGIDLSNAQNSRAWHNQRKQTIFAMVERAGRVKVVTVPSRYGYTLRTKLHDNLKPTAIVYTDDFSAYSGINRRWRHHTIDHSAQVYVMGHVHTQTVEGFFGLVKNAIHGVHHGVSKKWLQGYLNEFAWRWNHRDDREAMFRLLLHRAALTS
jgi:transposase